MKTILKIVICKRIYGVVLLIISSAICFYCNSLWGIETRESLHYPLHGICYSPFRDGESPNLGIFPGIDAIKEDLSILSKMTLNIRTYGTDDVLYEIPRLCNEFHINCYVGGWISGDESFNRKSVNNLIQIANQRYDTTQGLIVGNEVLLRGDISESRLIEYIKKVKDTTNIPVTTAETFQIYLKHPKIADVVDIILIHVHPYCDKISIINAPQYVLDKWKEVRLAYPQKDIIIGEVGWPSKGEICGVAVPSEENQKKFLEEFRLLAEKNGIQYFFFSAFDETWKKNGNEMEGHWGLHKTDRTKKPALLDLYKIE